MDRREFITGMLASTARRSTWTAAVCAVALGGATSALGGLLYEPSCYVAQESLALNLDGIRNVGALKAHDSAATEWKDLSHTANNAVFICYAPYDDPQVAIAVVVERGSAGANIAPIARELLDAYFTVKTVDFSVQSELSILP